MHPQSRAGLRAQPCPVPPAPAPSRPAPSLLTLPALALLAGCQAGPGLDATAAATTAAHATAMATSPLAPAPAPAGAHGDAPEAAQVLARLGPERRVVSVVANGSESWEQVGARLQQACRERFPALGPAPAVTVVDQREVRREVDLSVPAPGAYMLPPEGTPRAALRLKKALAGCAATPA